MSDDIVATDTEPSVKFATEVTRLCAEFPLFAVWREAPSDRAPRFVARRLRDGIHPFCVITRDPDELRSVLSASQRSA